MSTWQVYAAGSNLGSPTANNTFQLTVTADSSDGSSTTESVGFGNGATFPEAVSLNSPRSGYLAYAGGAVTASDGSTFTVQPNTQLPLRGIGIEALILPALGWFDLSVTQP